MNIYFTFSKEVHLGAAFTTLKARFKTAFLEKNNEGVNEVVINVADFEENKDKFPTRLLKKVVRCRSGALHIYDWLFGYRPFDNHIKHDDRKTGGMSAKSFSRRITS